MAGRHKKFNEKEVLVLAMDTFWSKGYEATSLDDLLAAMNVNKGSLYHTFGNKKQLFTRALEFFAEDVLKMLEAQFEKTDNPVAVIKDFYLDMCGPGSASNFKKGCLLSNSVTELALVRTDLETYAANQLMKMETLFCQELKKGQQRNVLNRNIDAGMLAKQLMNFWHGIHVTMRIYNCPDDLQQIVDDFFDMALNRTTPT